MPENTVAHSETSDTCPDLDDLAREIRAEDERVFDPGKYEVADELFYPIEGVDGDRVVLDDDLVLAWVRVGRGLDLESGLLRSEPRSSIRWHSKSSFLCGADIMVDNELAADGLGQLRPEEGAGGVRSRPTFPAQQSLCDFRCDRGGEVCAVADAEPAFANCSVRPFHPSVPPRRSSRHILSSQWYSRYHVGSEAADAGDAKDRFHGRQDGSNDDVRWGCGRGRDDGVGVARSPGCDQFAARAAARGENVTVGDRVFVPSRTSRRIAWVAGSNTDPYRQFFRNHAMTLP